MNKKTIVSLIITTLLISVGTANAITNTNSENTNSPEEKEWTIMLYDDADFNKAYDPLSCFSSQAFSNRNINTVVLQDKKDEAGKLWQIDENHNKILLKEMGEINMGDYTTLKNFLNYSKNNFPAERYILFFYNHGMGWKGACTDTTNNSDHLTMDEIQKAMIDTNGVDITCFSAPCLMGSIESAYELRNCTEIYIGSEETSGYIYWGDIIDDICNLINTNPDISNQILGKKIIEKIEKNIRFSPKSYTRRVYRKARRLITMSAIQTNEMNDLAKSIDKLAKNLSRKINQSTYNHIKIKIIHHLTQSFADYIPLTRSSIIDLYDFSKKCHLFFILNKSLRKNTKEVIQNIDKSVIAETHGIKHLDAHGLSIYLPTSRSYDSKYTNSNLDFINDTYWDEFQQLYIN